MNTKEELLKEKYGKIRGGQTKLAKDLGVKQGTISRWFTNELNAGKDYIEKLATIFNKSEEEIKKIFCDEKSISQKGNINIGDGNPHQIANFKELAENTETKLLKRENDVFTREVKILKKEIELLKKEMELLKKENESLRKETKIKLIIDEKEQKN